MARRSPARFLAPIALAAVVVALLVVVNGGKSKHRSSSGSAPASQGASPAASATPRKKKTHARKTYVVRAGDTPSAIAARTGVPLEELQRLNPNLDPQSLSVGQRVKLRE